MPLGIRAATKTGAAVGMEVDGEIGELMEEGEENCNVSYHDAAMAEKNVKDGVYKDIKERKCKNHYQDKIIQKSNKDLYQAKTMQKNNKDHYQFKTMQKSNKDLCLAKAMQQYSNSKDHCPDKTMQKSNKDLGDFEAIFPVAAYATCLLILGVLWQETVHVHSNDA